jgi:hypothetical protein
LGAVIAKEPHPFVVGAGEITSPLCTSILLSIASPKVLHFALHTGPDSNKEYGLHTFSKYRLQYLEEAQDAT